MKVKSKNSSSQEPLFKNKSTPFLSTMNTDKSKASRLTPPTNASSTITSIYIYNILNFIKFSRWRRFIFKKKKQNKPSIR